MRSSLLILAYHDVDPVERNPWTLAPVKFAEQLRYLQRRGYQIIPLDRARSALRCEPADRRFACVTFDDGRLGCFEHALPRLYQYEVKATFFICPGLFRPDRPANEGYSRFMTWAQVCKLLDQGHTLGAHALQHHSMAGISPSEAWLQLFASRAVIHRETGFWCDNFAPPYGDTDLQIKELAQAAGYRTLATTELGFADMEDPFALQRYQVTSRGEGSRFIETIEQLESCCADPRVLVHHHSPQ